LTNPEEDFIGIDLGGTNLRAGLVDAEGRILKRAATLTRAAEGKEKVISRITGLVKELSDSRHIPVGVASPGPVERGTGVLLNPPNLPGWHRVDLKYELQSRLRRKVYVENDANMVACGEFHYGAGKGARSLLCLTIGTGIGSGLILDGSLYTGDHGFAAELGHTVIDPRGPDCGCGARGCLESLAAARAMVSEARRLIRDGAATTLEGAEGELTAEAIGLAAAEGDAVAEQVLERAGRHLGIAISNAVALLDVSLVVVGGGISRAKDLILEPIRKTVARTLLDYDLRELEIVPSELGDDAGILGIFAYCRSSV